MLHIALHFLGPLAISIVLFSSRWQRSFALMLVGLVIDLDHLLATPIYDPSRCSIGFHPLHSEIAIGVYVLLLLVSLPNRFGEQLFGACRDVVNLVAIGLSYHILLDALDCYF